MPFLQLQTTASLSDHQRDTLLAALSKIVSETIGKPEEYVMVSLTPAQMLMSGQDGETAFVDVRSIGGLEGGVCPKLAEKIGAVLRESLGVPPERIFLNFTEVAANRWGWKGSTIG